MARGQDKIMSLGLKFKTLPLKVVPIVFQVGKQAAYTTYYQITKDGHFIYWNGLMQSLTLENNIRRWILS